MKNILLHLRFPFSIFLMPVFLFAICFEKWGDFTLEVGILFLILHLLVYPSSNAYNSFMDRDEGSIGGLKNPPKVTKCLFYVSILFDTVAISWSFLVLNFEVSWLMVSYILASRAYSYRGIRLKKYPILGYLTVSIFQGVVVFWMVRMQMGNDEAVVLGSMIAFLLVGAGYPLTQIYQHEQDKRDGVITLSAKLGLRGTFIFSGVLFFLLGLFLTFYLFQNSNYPWWSIGLSMLVLFPVGWVFGRWMKDSFGSAEHANFHNTMKMNNSGGLGLNLLFLVIFIVNQA